MQKIGKLEYMLLHTHYGRVYAAIWMPRFQENCVESGVKADLEPRTSNATGTCQDLLVAEKKTRIGNRTPRFEIAGKAKCVVFFCFLLWPPVAGSNSSLLLHPFANCTVSLAPKFGSKSLAIYKFGNEIYLSWTA